MLNDVVRALWAEPRAPGPPRRVRRDWALVGVVLVAAIVEATLREQVPWRPFSFVMAVGLAFTLLWRRTHPLAMVLLAFGSVIVVDLAILIASPGVAGLYSMAYLLVLAYALARWGAGSEVAIGLGLMLLTAALGIAVDFTGVGDAVGGTLVLLFPVWSGLTVRYWASSRLRELDQVKLRERATLARELHDTVGHHVSAIAIRAQAGRLLAASHPGAAVDALDVIEQEASRALAEMRIVVGGLRDGETAALAPQPGVADLEQLAISIGHSPRVHVSLSGALDDLSPPVDVAIYRIVQESVTNAVRHGRRTTRVDVRVVGEHDCVQVTVRDDGEASVNGVSPSGYGVVGMTERAKLIGGTLEAGPGPDRGWRVHAVLPKRGAAR